MPIHREPRCAVCWPTIPATFEGAGGAKLFVDSVATQCASGDAQGNILSSEVLPLTLAAKSAEDPTKAGGVRLQGTKKKAAKQERLCSRPHHPTSKS